MSYFDELAKYQEGMSSRLEHAQSVADEVQGGALAQVKDAYDTITSALGTTSSSLAGVGAAISLAKKVREKRALRKEKEGKEDPDEDEDEGEGDTGGGEGSGEPTGDSGVAGGESGDAVSGNQPINEMEWDDTDLTGGAEVSGAYQDPLDWDAEPTPTDTNLTEGGSADATGAEAATPAEGEAAVEGRSAAGAAEGGADDIEEGARAFAKRAAAKTAATATEETGGSVLADVGEAVGDFIDPGMLAVSAVTGIVDLFEDIFGQKTPTMAQKVKDLSTAPGVVASEGIDPSALQKAAN